MEQSRLAGGCPFLGPSHRGRRGGLDSTPPDFTEVPSTGYSNQNEIEGIRSPGLSVHPFVLVNK